MGGYSFPPQQVLGLYPASFFGLLGNGSDETVAWNAALAYILAAGGGTLQLESKKYRIDGATALPFTAGSPVTQKPLRITGTCPMMSQAGGPAPGGTILDLRYAGAIAKIDTRGQGYLEIDHISMIDDGVSTTPFIQSTNTILHVHDCYFQGNPTKSTTTCDQDAIILGGATSTVFGTGASDAPFQGYGTVIENNYFQRIRRAVYFRVFANGIQFVNNTVFNFCGSNLADGAAIESDGLLDTNTELVITGNLVEMIGYPYGIKFQKSNLNNIAHNNFYDPTGTTIAYVFFADAASSFNLVIEGWCGGAKPGVIDNSIAAQNTVITARQNVTTKFPGPVDLANAVVTANAQGIGLLDAPGNRMKWTFSTPNQMYLEYFPVGGPAENLWMTTRLSATAYTYALGGSVTNRLTSANELRIDSLGFTRIGNGTVYGLVVTNQAVVMPVGATLEPRIRASVFGNLPATPVEGMIQGVTDSSTAVWRATITGGGANHVLAYYNGTNWTVMG